MKIITPKQRILNLEPTISEELLTKVYQKLLYVQDEVKVDDEMLKTFILNPAF